MKDVKLSQEQCEEMFDILKPIKVCLTSANDPDLFEALFHSKTLVLFLLIYLFLPFKCLEKREDIFYKTGWCPG